LYGNTIYICTTHRHEKQNQKGTSFQDGQVGMETTINKLKKSHVLKSGSVQTLLTKLLQLVPGKTSENLSIVSVHVRRTPCDGVSASFFLEQVLLTSRKV
jgi:hypothetical protein